MNPSDAHLRFRFRRMTRAAWIRIAAVATGLLVATCVEAAPRVPRDDAEVLERLPLAPRGVAVRALQADRAALARDPTNLGLALRLARAYSEIGRSSGDPRYSGYAEAVLRPWWHLKNPPTAVLTMRATIEQRAHRFEDALTDLSTVLARDPMNVQARFTRSTIYQVQGRFDAASRECDTFDRRTSRLILVACKSAADAASGRLAESYTQLAGALESSADASPALRAWIATGLAEMAERGGKSKDAETRYREAMALDPDDFYLLGAWSDFLLDRGREREVVALLASRTTSDPLLLRYTIALKRLASPDADRWREQLSSRFDASRRRGDKVHLREEARFALQVERDPKRALTLARENWKVQREAADARILLEAAWATADDPVLREIGAWFRRTRFEDVRCEAILRGAAGRLA